MNLYEIIVCILLGVPGGLVLWLAIRYNIINNAHAWGLVGVGTALILWSAWLMAEVEKIHPQPFPGLFVTMTIGTFATPLALHVYYADD